MVGEMQPGSNHLSAKTKAKRTDQPVDGKVFVHVRPVNTVLFILTQTANNSLATAGLGPVEP